MAPHRSWFECSQCRQRFPLDEVIPRCPQCAGLDKRTGLLEVCHDLNALRQRSPHAWKELFDRRYQRIIWPYGSGVWGKKEWIAPQVDDANVVSAGEGGTNLFWASRLGEELGLADLWIKLCGNSHTGSFKDLGMTVLVSMVNQMIREGKPIRAIACASTGDTSASLASYCAIAGLPAVVFLPASKISVPQLIQPVANGALTLVLDTDFDGCMALVAEVCPRAGLYLANSMSALRLEGQKSIAIEIVQQFDWQPVDWVILPVGNCGNITALGKGFLMMRELGLIDRLPRLVGAQAEKANPLADLYRRGYPEEPFVPRPARKTQANAIQIGDPVNLYKAIAILKQMPGHFVLDVTEDELAHAAARADRTGLFTCPHTGVALAALIQLVKRGKIAPQDRVVVLSTASGLKFPDFKIGYHLGADSCSTAPPGLLPEVSPQLQNPPVRLPANLDTILALIDNRLTAMERATS